MQEDTLTKAAGLCSFLIIFFAIFFFYSAQWPYGVVMVVTSAIGLRTLSASSKSARWVAFFAYLFLFFALIGWGAGNTIIGGWGGNYGLFGSLFSCPSPYSTYFARTRDTSAKWIDSNSAVRAGKNPHLIGMNWGYCDEGWLVTLVIFNLLELFFTSFMLISMARRLHTSTSKGTGLEQPFLS
jgi:energy-coupling factor transporter transmembrane protein EcfT